MWETGCAVLELVQKVDDAGDGEAERGCDIPRL